MLDTLVSGVCIVANRRANPGHFIRRDTDADARAADEEATLRGAGHKRFTDQSGKIGRQRRGQFSKGDGLPLAIDRNLRGRSRRRFSWVSSF